MKKIALENWSGSTADGDADDRVEWWSAFGTSTDRWRFLGIETKAPRRRGDFDIGFTLYADDLTIWAYHTCDLEEQEKALQHALDVHKEHLFRVGLRVSPEKTTYVHVASEKYHDDQVAERLHLVLAGGRISPSPSVGVLGIEIREDTAADSLLEETIQTSNNALNIIRRICTPGSGASNIINKRLCKALVLSGVF